MYIREQETSYLIRLSINFGKQNESVFAKYNVKFTFYMYKTDHV